MLVVEASVEKRICEAVEVALEGFATMSEALVPPAFKSEVVATPYTVRPFVPLPIVEEARAMRPVVNEMSVLVDSPYVVTVHGQATERVPAVKVMPLPARLLYVLPFSVSAGTLMPPKKVEVAVVEVAMKYGAAMRLAYRPPENVVVPVVEKDCSPVHVFACPVRVASVGRHVPPMAKQPEASVKPFAAVEVALAPVRLRYEACSPFVNVEVPVPVTASVPVAVMLVPMMSPATESIFHGVVVPMPSRPVEVE